MLTKLPDSYTELDQKLRQNGLCIAPVKATEAMKDAAGQTMRKRKERMGSDWFMVGTKTKAGLRWDAMLEAWLNG